MKIVGYSLEGPSIMTLVLPREKKNIVIKARAVLDYTEFEAKVQPPSVPKILIRGKGDVDDLDDENYQKAFSTYLRKKSNWMILKSLEATDGLIWDSIKMDKPETWEFYTKEFREAGFTDNEVMRIVNLVMQVNGLDNSKIDEATARFLAESQVAKS